jgi:predicted aspartyl protease
MKPIPKTLLMIALLCGPGAARSESAGSAPSVLEAYHLAVGNLPANGSAQFDYRRTTSGMTGTATLRFDIATGAYVETQDVDGIRTSDGFDGATPWQQDVSLAYTPQLGGDRVRAAVGVAYRNANLWWRPDRGGATIGDLGPETDGDVTLEHLSIAPKGGKRFDAWFDTRTHLLTKITYDLQFFHVTETYSDYRREGNLLLAHRIAVDPGMGSAGIDTSELTRVSFAAAATRSTYACPKIRPTGVKINSAGSSTVPFRLLNNHIYFQAKVNGKGPYTFILDTGGHTLLSPHLVQDLGLKPVGEAVTSGAGEGHETTGFVRYDEIAIGDLRQTHQVGLATKIYDASIEGIPVDGMEGFELIRRVVTTIDYGKQIITFTDPAKFKARRELGVAVPFVFYDHLPFVEGTIAGLPVLFDIDTGSRSQIDLTSPFVLAHDLKARFAKGTSAVVGWGVGGPARSYVVRLASLKLGSVEVHDVVAGLSEARGGSLSDPNFQGNIGSGLLKQFVVTLDYAHQLMYLKRIVPLPSDVGTFDRSGLWINANDGGFGVQDVATGSAAADAGIETGDLITAIDGKPAVTDGLAEARHLLRDRPAGTTVALTVTRGTATRIVTLTLRDQI